MEASELTFGRFGLSANAIGGKIYAIGGYRGGPEYLNVVEELDTGLPFSVEPTGKLPMTLGELKTN